MSGRIQVSVIDDDGPWRQMLHTVLNAAPGFHCASTHPNAEHALKHLPSAAPDVALVDISLPRLSGIECVMKLRALRPKLQFLMLTVHSDEERLFRALQAGAHGYLLKATDLTDLLQAIRLVCAGGAPMSPGIARQVIAHFRRPTPAAPLADRLTPREQAVVDEISRGARVKDVARVLNLSEATVQSHVRHIYEKLQVSSRAGLFAALADPARHGGGAGGARSSSDNAPFRPRRG
ncbi:MAG TPA: response regulator transcription factor [Methylomirabilota bacterium]|nr:response regulator transcription factor [Methylomirabilota bacterium]